MQRARAAEIAGLGYVGLALDDHGPHARAAVGFHPGLHTIRPQEAGAR